MKENSKTKEVIQSGISAVNSNIEFWEDAQVFLKTQIPKNFEDNLKEYVLEKGYNKNEFRLFKFMLQEAIGYYGTIIILKHFELE